MLTSTPFARRLPVLAFIAALSVAAVGACTPQTVPELSAAIPGFTLADLEEIQDDERLTDDQRRDMIREAVGAPEDDDGDRLVEFLLDFNVP